MTEKLKAYKIAETYIRIKIPATKNNKERLISILAKEAEIYSKEFFKGKIKYRIVVEEGSLKGKITIYGAIIVLIEGVSNYGSFRQGLQQIISDSQHFSENVIEHTKQNDNSYRINTERTERRLGLPGRLKRTLDRINYLEQHIDDLPLNQVRRELTELKQDLSNIINSLDTQERNSLEQFLPNDLRNSLPAPNERGTQEMINRYAIKEEEIRLTEDE